MGPDGLLLPCCLNIQCTIIRTTELAAVQEKLTELEKQKEELLRSYSPSALLQKLHGNSWEQITLYTNGCKRRKPKCSLMSNCCYTDAMDKVEEESEVLHRQLLEKEIDLATFVPKYKKLRTIYHRRALLHLSARTTM